MILYARSALLRGISSHRNSIRQYSKEKHTVHALFSNGRRLTIETGGYARLADGAAVATLGNTSVLVAAVSKRSAPSAGPASFLPLTVDYKQKYAAAGYIPTNFLKREMGLSEQEVLTSRVIDRSVRPLFPDGFRDETKLTCSLMAVDGIHGPDAVSINAASAALALSPVPWRGPVGAVRMGYCDDEWFICPTRRELRHSSLDLLVTAGPKKTLVMMEGGGNVVPLPKLQRAIKMAVQECQIIIRAIEDLAVKAGKPKMAFSNTIIPEDVIDAVKSEVLGPLHAILQDYAHHKQSRDQAWQAVRQEAIDRLSPVFPGQERLLDAAFNEVFKQTFRSLILDTGVRCDGRSATELRDVSCEVDVFPALHGSSVFQRGQTQVQCTVAYDSMHPNSAINPLLKATGGQKDSAFLLHYDFPQYATNDIGRSGPVSRREIGHGALAERALRPLVPANQNMVILLAATVLESNGSSSMATVCGGSLALYDAGVPLLAPAAGVAIGLVTDTDEAGKITRHKVLTDILGIEDYLGDMDFKIAGTRQGITAVQADIKLPGLPLSIVMEALIASTAPKNAILRLTEAVLSSPRVSKDTWPVVSSLEVPPQRRAKLMGPGGITIRKLQATTGVQIFWEDNNKISVFAPNKVAHEEAKESLDALLEDRTPELEFGAVYSASVTELRPSGVMVTLYDDMTPVLLHNSQLDVRRVHHPSALGMEVGQSIKVKYFGRDATSGQMRLSRRALQAATLVTRNLQRRSDTSDAATSSNNTTDVATSSNNITDAGTSHTDTTDAAIAAATVGLSALRAAAAADASKGTDNLEEFDGKKSDSNGA